MAQPDTGTWYMANRLAEGQLADLIIDRRTSGESWTRMCAVLLAAYGIDVSPVTLSAWHRQLCSPAGEATGPSQPSHLPAGDPSEAAR